MLPATPGRTLVAQIFSIVYFGFFIALYITSKNEKTKPEPERVTK
jgi:ubiquinol-cytochrome c reductase cytochrome b subunit